MLLFRATNLWPARIGVTDKMVRRYAANLEGKGYLRREARIGNTNSFDLNPLFAALAKALEEEKKLGKAAQERSVVEPWPE